MRILVDYRPAVRQRTGVGEYMHELVCSHTAAYDDAVAVFTSSWKDRPPPGLGQQLHARVIDRRVPVSVLNYLWHRAGWPPVELLAGSFDVVHAAHPLLIPARRAAQVVTVHDLFFMTAPERTRAEIRRDYAELTPLHVRRADAIVTPSAYTKRGVEALGVPGDRIHVCAPGAPRWRTLGDRPSVPKDGCILFMGTLEPRKNVGVLLDAYERLRGRLPGAPDLVLAGGAAPEAAAWLERIARPPLAGHVRALGYVANADRETWYGRARVLVLPSLDEGFGLPVLEAMSAGVPVIASTRGSLPEVTGGAAPLVEPHDADGLAAELERMIVDDDYARARAEAGLDRARAFTWPAAARALHDAYLAACTRRARKGTNIPGRGAAA